MKSCNYVLEREKSGFRFVDKKITSITSPEEIEEVESLLNNSSGKLEGVNKHIRAAISKYSDRKEPDYRNSIKESISAVEAIVAIIIEDKNATLGKALKKLNSKITINQALISGYLSIYGYTSDADGIRHALMDESNVSSEDAKYMLVSCSAFVNYLIEKSSKAGIDLNN